MGLFDRFPWVNTHDLNLDWIIQKMKEWGADAAQNVAKAETAATNAATAAENAATTAEPYAVRAEEASTRAASRALDCLTYVANCKEYSESAETAKTCAANSAKTSAEWSNSAKSFASNAEASATAAAQSAEEAKTATKWPYDGVYNGYLYKRLDTVDPYTTTKMEFLTAPQENGVLYRVSGRIPKRASFNDATTRDYHYEKILKMVGNAGSNFITFGDGFTPEIPGLVIAEAEPVGLLLFLNSDNSFYKYSSLPLASMNESNQFIVDSSGFEIPDDNAANITVSLQNEGLSPSEVTAYLYVRMKYTL